MSSDSLDEAALSQFWPTIMTLLILGGMSVAHLAIAPWGRDPLYSSISHFLTFWPLTLLAVLIYVAKTKLDDAEREVPNR